MKRFAFKPALLLGRKSYQLKADILSLEGDGGWDLPLGEVTRIGLVDLTVKGQRMTRLDLQAGATKRRIELNQSAIAWGDNSDTKPFLALIRAVGAALATAQPDACVTLGEYGRARLIGFAVGVLSALGGLAIFVFALVSGVGENQLISAIVPVLIMLVLGIATTRAYWPWRKLPDVPIAEFPQIVEFMEKG